MSGKMRKRQLAVPKDNARTMKILKGFSAPQKDSSKRQRRKANLNNYKQEDD